MIHIRLLRREGLLMGVEAQGHAGWDKAGRDIVCAAVSVLLRSTARTLAQRYKEGLRFEAPKPGVLSLILEEENTEWTNGVWMVLDQGLRDLAMEFPKAILIERQER